MRADRYLQLRTNVIKYAKDEKRVLKRMDKDRKNEITWQAKAKRRN